MLISEYVLFILSNYDLYKIDDILNMTLSEINILKKSANMREEREIQKIYLDNWLSRQVNATDKHGKKYIYKSFDDFYTYDNNNSDSEAPKIKKRGKNAVVDENYSARRTTEDLVKIALRLRALNERKNLDS